MGKKGGPTNPYPEIPEDVWLRAKKLFGPPAQVCKPPLKPPDLTEEDLAIQPAFHGEKEFASIIRYWKKCAVVPYSDKAGTEVPTRMRIIESEAANKKPHEAKEMAQLAKFMKKFVGASKKRTDKFLAQLLKREKKEGMRTTVLDLMGTIQAEIDRELKNSRDLVKEQELFDPRWMMGTKLGDLPAPKQRTLIAVEMSAMTATYFVEILDEVTKLINKVICPEGNEASWTQTFEICTFSSVPIDKTPADIWQLEYKGPAEVDKKGTLNKALALKWLTKRFTAKNCANAGANSPDYVALFNKFADEGHSFAGLPYRIYMCCSRAPDDREKQVEVLERLTELRKKDPPSKNETTMPINVVAFDPTVGDDADQKAFFEGLAGEGGKFMVDTSRKDLECLAETLKRVKGHEKKLAKAMKKSLKYEDLSARVVEDQDLLQQQVALHKMVENDFEVFTWALANEAPPAVPEI